MSCSHHLIKTWIPRMLPSCPVTRKQRHGIPAHMTKVIRKMMLKRHNKNNKVEAGLIPLVQPPTRGQSHCFFLSSLITGYNKLFWWVRNSSGVHLTDIVEVSMWHFLLSCQFFHLIQQYMHLELGAQVLQTTVAEGLSKATGRGRDLKRTLNCSSSTGW